MTTLADANRLRQAQSQVIGSAEGELSRVFRSLDLSRPASARDALLEAYPSLARNYGDMAATVSAEWYEELRRTQVGGSYSAMLAAAPPAERLTRSVRWAAGSLFTDNPGAMLSLLSGSMTRALGDASRDTVRTNVQRDGRAAGWQRLHQPDACGFCQMLHGRGGVYKRNTADFASHDNCRCVAAPSWDKGAPEVSVREYEMSQSMASLQRRASDPDANPSDRAKAQEQIENHRARTREWIAENL